VTGTRLGEPRCAIDREINLMTGTAEHGLHERGDVGIVFDNQNVSHSCPLHADGCCAYRTRRADDRRYLQSMPPTAPSLAAPAAREGLRRALLWTAGPLAVFALAVVGTHLLVADLTVALWWPAARAAACFALHARRSGRPAMILALVVIFAASVIANFIGGRDLPIALAYGAANAMEIGLLITLLFWRAADLRLQSLRDAARFCVAALIAALALGLVVAGIGAAAYTHDFATVAILVAASHASAIMLIAPFGLLPPRLDTPLHWVEIALQTVLLGVAVAVALRPGSALPLSFLVFAVLVWAALRFPPVVAFAQSALLAVTVVALTIISGSRFLGADLAPVDLAVTTDAFLCTIAIFTVTVVSAQYSDAANTIAVLHAARVRVAAERETSQALRLHLELDRQREDFLAATSHELRTPVTIIAGYASLLTDETLAKPHDEWVGAISRNAARLSLLLSNLLAVAGAARNDEPSADDIAAHELVDGVLQALASVIDEADCTVVAPIDTTPRIFADRRDARHLVNELVSNAVKFSGRGGTVRLEAKLVGDDVVFTVDDDGPGMDADEVAQAFDPFYRAPGAAMSSTPGLGLGLPIARTLARRNGGDITIV